MEDVRWEKQDVNRLLANQKDYFNSGETKNITFRIKQLKKLKNIIKINEIAIKEALYKDLGKSSFESYATEIGYVLKEISIFIKKLKAYSSIERKRTPIYSKPLLSRHLPPRFPRRRCSFLTRINEGHSPKEAPL